MQIAKYEACRVNWLQTTVIVSGLLMMTPRADAHNWYPKWCCSEKDCAVAIEVRSGSAGWVIMSEQGTTFVPRNFRHQFPSIDERIHICMEDPGDYDYGLSKGLKRPLCVFWPKHTS